MILISSTACSSTQQRINQAGAVIGASQARIQLPDLPIDCRRDTPHAPVKVGDEMVSIYKRERGQVDEANDKKDRCNAFFDQIRQGLAGDGD